MAIYTRLVRTDHQMSAQHSMQLGEGRNSASSAGLALWRASKRIETSKAPSQSKQPSFPLEVAATRYTSQTGALAWPSMLACSLGLKSWDEAYFLHALMFEHRCGIRTGAAWNVLRRERRCAAEPLEYVTRAGPSCTLRTI